MCFHVSHEQVIWEHFTTVIIILKGLPDVMLINAYFLSEHSILNLIHWIEMCYDGIKYLGFKFPKCANYAYLLLTYYVCFYRVLHNTDMLTRSIFNLFYALVLFLAGLCYGHIYYNILFCYHR